MLLRTRARRQPSGYGREGRRIENLRIRAGKGNPDEVRFELRFERLAVCAKRGDAASDDAGSPRDRMAIKERRGAAVVSGPDPKLNRGRPREGFDTECGNGKIQQPIVGTELPRLRESESHGRRDAAGMGQRGCGISRFRPWARGGEPVERLVRVARRTGGTHASTRFGAGSQLDDGAVEACCPRLGELRDT